MYTQVELVSTTDEVFVYWLDHDFETVSKIRSGLGIRISEERPYLRVNRVFLTLKNLSDLPTKHKIGNIVEIN